MIRSHAHFAVCAALLVAASAAMGARGASAEERVYRWSVADASGATVKLHLDYERRSDGSTRINSDTREVPIGILHGLSAAEINASPAAVRQFTIVEDPGKLVCEGAVGDGHGSGTYHFVADPAFGRELARRGIAPANNDDQLLSLALGHFKLATLDAVAAAGFTRPTLDDLVAATDHGVTDDFVRAFKDVSLTPKTLHALAQLRDHGVTAQYVQSFVSAGYKPISADDLTLARDHGVDASQAAAMHAAMPSLSMRGLATLRDHGTSSELIAALAAAHFRSLSDSEISSLADHGVRPALIRALAASDYRTISAADIDSIADHGVPAAYITELQQMGFHPSVNELVRLRDNGVSTAFIRHLRDRGYRTMSTDDIIRLYQQGV